MPTDTYEQSLPQAQFSAEDITRIMGFFAYDVPFAIQTRLNFDVILPL